MRVMLLAPGDCIHSQRFLQWLQRGGCEVIFVDDVMPPNLDSSRFVRYPGGIRQLGKALWRFNTFLRRWQLRYVWKRLRPDVVHVHWVGAKAYDCGRARLKPLVLTCWGTDINIHFLPEAHPAWRKSTGYALSCADFVFADSPEVLERCNLLAGRPVRSLLLLMGIDTICLSPRYAEGAEALRGALGIARRAKVLLSVRAWKPRYRHDLILEAFARVRRTLPFETVLIFKRYCVEVSSYEDELRLRARKLGAENHVLWIDNIPYARMPELYALADVVVNFPRFDAFPVTFIEAAACGKRVISNRLPAYEGFGLERFFRMVPTDSVDELAKAMAEVLMESPEVAAFKAEEARKWAEEYGDERKCAEKTLAVYRRLIKQHG